MSAGDCYRGVALLGRAGTGKTTLADALVKAGVADRRESFAGPLKRDLEALGVRKGQPGAREVMIAYGTSWGRAQSPDMWIERLRFDLHDDFDGLAIDDVRFPNEAAFLRERGYLTVKLVAGRAERLERGIDDALILSYTPSESSLDQYPSDILLNTARLSVSECVALVAEALDPVPA